MKLPGPTPRSAALMNDLRALLGDGSVSCDPADLWAASRDSSARTRLWTKARLAPPPPDLVAWPADATQVAQIIRYAAARQLPVLSPGAKSGAAPGGGGIALDLRRLSGKPLIDLPGRTVEVRAGQDRQRLEEQLQAEGATLGPFPRSIDSPSVGGWLATPSLALSASRRDLVLALEAVSGEGEVLQDLTGPSAAADQAQPGQMSQLSQLLVGSEGTLGVITRARLRLWPLQRARFLRGVRFATLEQGLQALGLIARAGLRPWVAQLFDPLESLLARGELSPRLELPAALRLLLTAGAQESLRLLLRGPSLLNRLAAALPTPALLALGFQADRESDATQEGRAALRLCLHAGGEEMGPGVAEQLLRRREEDGFRQAPLFSAGAFVDTLQVVATAWDRIAALHDRIRTGVAAHALVLARFSPASPEGCAASFTFIGLAGETAAAIASGEPDEAELDLEGALARLNACWSAALAAVAGHRPTPEGELQALKRAFDPHGILNPAPRSP